MNLASQFFFIAVLAGQFFPNVGHAGQWGGWSSVPQCPGVSIRVKHDYFNTFSNQDVWYVGVQNNNAFSVSLGIDTTPLGQTSTIPNGAWSVNPLGGEYVFALNFTGSSPDPGPILVWLYRVKNKDSGKLICTNVSVQTSGAGGSVGNTNPIGNASGNTSTGGGLGSQQPIYNPPPPPPANGILEATINDPTTGQPNWQSPLSSMTVSAGQKLSFTVREKLFSGQYPPARIWLFVDCSRAEHLLINGASCVATKNFYGIPEPYKMNLGTLGSGMVINVELDPQFQFTNTSPVGSSIQLSAGAGYYDGSIYGATLNFPHDFLYLESTSGSPTQPLFVTLDGVQTTLPTTVRNNHVISLVVPFSYVDGMGNTYRINNYPNFCTQTPGVTIDCTVNPSLIANSRILKIGYKKYVPTSATWRTLTINTTIDGQPAPGLMVYPIGGDEVFLSGDARPSPATYTYWPFSVLPYIQTPQIHGYQTQVLCSGTTNCSFLDMSANRSLTVNYKPFFDQTGGSYTMSNGSIFDLGATVSKGVFKWLDNNLQKKINFSPPTNLPTDATFVSPVFDYVLIGVPDGGKPILNFSASVNSGANASFVGSGLSQASLVSIDDIGNYTLVPPDRLTVIGASSFTINQVDGGDLDLDGKADGTIRNRLIFIRHAPVVNSTTAPIVSNTNVAQSTASSGGGGCLLGLETSIGAALPVYGFLTLMIFFSVCRGRTLEVFIDLFTQRTQD